MLNSYFFIPANKPKFINNIHKLEANYFIFDFEDTLPLSQTDEALLNIKDFSGNDKIWIRPNIFNGELLTLEQFNTLYHFGFRQFVLPKLNSKEQYFEFEQNYDDVKFILLVEHPRLLFELLEILKKSKQIYSLSFGSQDYASITDLKQEHSIMNQVRYELNKYAKAFNLDFIDTASMNITNKKQFEDECINAFNYGCNGKFIIHPTQLTVLKSAEYYSSEEIAWAIEALKSIEMKDYENIEAYLINGKVFEKPHLKKVMQIKKYIESK